MRAYSQVYLDEIVENQEKLFDFVANNFSDMDTQAYVNTRSAMELWDYFIKTENCTLKPGVALEGFIPEVLCIL